MMESIDFTEDEEIFNQFEVIISKAPAAHITEMNVNGVIFIFRNKNSYFIEWRPNDNVEISIPDEESVDSQESDWSFVNQIVYRPAIDSISLLSPKAKNYRIPLADLKKMRVEKSELKLYDHNELNFVNCIFNRSKPSSFIRALEMQNVLKQSVTDEHIYICKDPDHEKLQRSFAELNIEEIKNSKLSRPRHWIAPGFDFLNKLASVPGQVLGKDPNVLNDRYHTRRPEYNSHSDIDQDHENMKLEMDLEVEKSDGTEKIIIEDPLPARNIFKREAPLSEKQWREFVTEDGRISDPERIREIIFRGGVLPEIRQEVWKFLLGYDIWEHTAEERAKRREELRIEYYLMESQWTTLSKTQEKNFTAYRDRKCQAEKDVKRTDRCHEYFMGDDNPNLDKLQDILLTYIMYNFDVGYVQGMSDLLSPILCLMEDKDVSFWCFVGFMDKVFQNFDEDQAGMKKQLDLMRTLMNFSNPTLFKYFKEHDSDNMYFCFRWLLVWYKREFNSTDILELWEVLWSGLPCTNFHLLVGIAILDQEMECFIENEFGFTEILKHVNELSEKMNLKEILENAESIYYQIKNAAHLNDRIRVIIGEEPLSKTMEDDIYDSDTENTKNNKEFMTKSEEDEMQRKIEEECDNAMSIGFF